MRAIDPDQAHSLASTVPKLFLETDLSFHGRLFIEPRSLNSEWDASVMKRQSLPLLLLAVCLTGLSISSETALAQEAGNQPETSAPSKEWYYGPTTAEKAPTKTLGRQKAELRAKQRLSRMETMRWYGFSPSRPTATGIPFTSAWHTSWHTSRRPVLIVSPYYYRTY